MIIALIILIIVTILIIGLFQVYSRHSKVVRNSDFAGEYRYKFVFFANKYFQKYDRYNRSGDFDTELYVWLTMNVSKIQNHVGSFGVMSYKPAFQNYMFDNYHIIINTIPKFRDGQVEVFDVGAVDDCLLRYIGYLEECRKRTLKNLKNPITWFREGFIEILSLPIFLLSSFGIISNRTLNSIKDSLVYKAIGGLLAFVTLVSGLITIAVGYDQTLLFIKRVMGK